MADLALGQDSRQRVRATQALLVVAVDLLLALVCAFGVWTDLIDPTLALAWITFSLVAAFSFYAVIRSGLNLYLSTTDPALTLAQGVFSVFSTVAAYLICGPVRGSVLLAMAITLVCGMFALKPGQLQRLSIFSVVLLGATMTWAHWLWPARFPAAEEGLHFMMIAVVLPTIALLAGQLSTMRHKLSQHRRDLEQALEHNRQLAIRDELTGLYNRRHVMELMGKEVHRAERSGTPLALALIDLDHFKRINDTYGHAQGDEVLKAFALAAAGKLRDTDVLGRWGGEEFLVMLPGTDAERAVTVLARVQQHMEALAFSPADAPWFVSFSAGVADCCPGEPLAAAIERADAALYKAKQAGRKRSLVAEPCRLVGAPHALAVAEVAVPSCVP
ncbi:MAG: diguanylate cyclase [Rhizobacter sp.]